MTLEEMCKSAARYSDRYDEFEKTEDDNGRLVYEEDAAHYLNVFRDAINEAYFAIARNYGRPNTYTSVTVPADKIIVLTDLDPQPTRIKDVLDSEKSKSLDYVFDTRYEIRVDGAKEGDTVQIFYQYLPERLTALNDEPIFPESIVDPMIYISLAVARIWLSEKKIDLYNTWMNQYYSLVREVKADMRSSDMRRIPRRPFR